MRKVMVGMFTVMGLALLCSSTEAKPTKKIAKPASSSQPAPPSSSTPTPPPAAEGEWSLAEKQMWIAAQEELDSWMKRANDKCGTKIVGRFDKESFRGLLDPKNGSTGLPGYAGAHCSAGPGALDEICTVVNDNEASAKMARDAVKAKISVIECRWGGKGKSAMSLSDKKLTETIDVDTDNAAGFQDRLKTFIKSKI